jgi:hypothetical protein
MMTANILVMSKSTFSYIPGIYSDGLVLYYPFFHGPLRHWKTMSPKSKSFEKIKHLVLSDLGRQNQWLLMP